MKRLAPALVLLLALSSARAEPLTLKVDATASTPAPTTGHLKLGTSPGLAVNSQYLVLHGKPWLPVMGEFHYSRSPAASWAAELQKMKSAGIDIVASYVLWNHHEPQDGRISWQGRRDLRRFVQLAQQAGLKAMVRIGPWVHAEARYGGLPDWVVDAMPTRRNDAQYLLAVERFYADIGRQLRGLLWKDGGPVIGIQIENEYNLTGPGQGAAHISELKRLALKAGLDVPLYTVTGWDGAVYPSGEVTPVFGGYPDAPWGKGTDELPPRETYAFRFGSRVAADLGAQTAASARGTAESDAALTPFLGAEYGAGLPAMYRRRTLVSAQDIAAMLPVQLGSGVNLLGYYMFHGGRNPPGGALEESSSSGGYNDTPRISYDFNAPLGPDGQQREVLTWLRPHHYFLQAFGERLAPMGVYRPEAVPADARERKTPRWAVRARGDSAFVFVNNHVRQHAMPEFADLRFSVALPGGTVSFPRQGLTLRNGDHFIWPVNFALAGTRLVYATAQPLTRFESGKEIVHVFAAAEGQLVELALPAEDAAFIDAKGELAEGLLVFSGLRPGTTPVLTIRKGGRTEHVLVLTAEQGRQLVIGKLAGREHLLLTEGQAWFTPQGRLELRSAGQPSLSYSIFPAADRKAGRPDGLFTAYELNATPTALEVRLTATRPAGKAPPLLRGGLAGAALQPIPEAFAAAAGWRIELRGQAGPQVEDVLLQPDFVGDFARLFRGTEMLDDWYYSGQPWQVGARQLLGTPLNLAVMPLRADAPIYLPREHRPDFAGRPQVAELRGVHLIPVYRWTLN